MTSTTSTGNNYTSSPWGPVQTVEQYADGIAFLTTASHGGFALADHRVAQLPERYRAFAAKWSKGWEQSPTWTNYYEEDCAALAVLVTWPALLNVHPLDVPRYKERLERYVTESH